MDYLIIERRKRDSNRNIITEDSTCYLTQSMENAVKWINENPDFDIKDELWWWVILKIVIDDEYGSELYKIYDWNGNELNEQP